MHFMLGFAIHTVFFIPSEQAVFVLTLFLFFCNFWCDSVIWATEFVKNF